MKKSTKGAVAAGGAAVLLLGGAGSLAYWTASGSVDGGSITSGTLTLSAGTCGDWTYADTSTVSLIVPGDTVTKTCSFTISATGDHLEATLDAPDSVNYTTSGNDATTLSLTASASYAVAGTPVASDGTGTITSANDGDTLTATFKVTFPYGDPTTINANDTQHLETVLDNNVAVTLTQADPNA